MATHAGAPLSARRRIAADHPAFDGHFPGRPILPGVVLLAEVLEAVRALPWLVEALGPAPLLVAAKFLAPVGPGSDLDVEIRVEERRLCFDVNVGSMLVAKGQYLLATSVEAAR